MYTRIAIVWFRKDLRIDDNPALLEAAQIGNVLPIYIIDEGSSSVRKLGKASRIWLSEALSSLDESVNHCLRIYKGNTTLILKTLLLKYTIVGIYWNKTYDPQQDLLDEQIKSELLKTRPDIHIASFNARLLWEPHELLKKDGSKYKVFTAFKNRIYKENLKPRIPLSYKEEINYCKEIDTPELECLPPEILIKKEEYQFKEKINARWKISEQSAHHLLQDFISTKLAGYTINRDYPSRDGTSSLSPYINFGQISPNRIWFTLIDELPKSENFLTQLIWREFAYTTLIEHPNLSSHNLQPKFNYFPWENNKQFLQSWSTGNTGYSIVDAGIRELLNTGYMHNRVRMIVGSFLTKNLLIHWKYGEEVFWEYLVDADPASNAFNWQWIAGSGTDAVPYFRIFNPTTQAVKFDPHYKYRNTWLNENKTVNSSIRSRKVEQSRSMFIVNEKLSRKKALASFHIANTQYKKSIKS